MSLISIMQKVFGKPRVVRDCGYITSENDNNKNCLKKSGTFEVQNYFCSCDSDLCNKAPSIQYTPIMAIISFLATRLRLF